MKPGWRKFTMTIIALGAATAVHCTVGLTDQMVTAIISLTGMYIGGNQVSKIAQIALEKARKASIEDKS